MLAATWPTAGQRVAVVYDSRLDEHGVVDDVLPPDRLVLREPASVTGEPPVGSPIHLFWSSTAGRHELVTELVRQVWDRMPLWELHVTQEPSVRQERAFARATVALPCELRLDQQHWRAIVVDIGEGGARCVLPEVEGLSVGAAIELRLALDGRELDLPAVLLSVDPGREERWVVRLRFTGLGRLSDLLRRQVMEQQRRSRLVSRV